MSRRVDRISNGFPSHDALLMTVCPSGANRAAAMCPRLNVSCENVGVAGAAAGRARYAAPAVTRSAAAATPISRRPQADGRPAGGTVTPDADVPFNRLRANDRSRADWKR